MKHPLLRLARPIAATSTCLAIAALASAQPAKLPVPSAAAPGGRKVAPEAKFATTQMSSAPVISGDTIRSVAARARRPPPAAGVVPAESVIVATRLNDGTGLACGALLTARIKVLGGARTPGLHTVTFLRAQAFPASGLSAFSLLALASDAARWRESATDQRTVDVVVNAGEERDVVLELGWPLRCTDRQPFEVDAFFVGMALPSNASQGARPPIVGGVIAPARPSVQFDFTPFP